MTREQTAFLGDDLNDLVVKRVTRLLIAPSNAVLLSAADFRDPAAVAASPRRGDGRSSPAPGTAIHLAPVAAGLS